MYATLADTAVKLQVQLLNLGNTILKGVVVALPEVSGLTCKTGTTATPDADVLTSGTAVSAAIDVSPKNKVVCEGTYTFLQAELDVDQTAKAFTPTLTTTSTGTSMDNAALPADSYTASASIPLGAAASLVLTVDAANCVKPTIIPAGQTSKLRMCAVVWFARTPSEFIRFSDMLIWLLTSACVLCLHPCASLFLCFCRCEHHMSHDDHQLRAPDPAERGSRHRCWQCLPQHRLRHHCTPGANRRSQGMHADSHSKPE